MAVHACRYVDRFQRGNAFFEALVSRPQGYKLCPCACRDGVKDEGTPELTDHATESVENGSRRQPVPDELLARPSP